MHPLLILLSAFAVPPVMLVLIAGPLYAGCYAGLVWLYGYGISDQAMNLDYQLSSYGFLIDYWRKNAGLAFLDFLLPAFGPPLVGLVSGLVFFTLFVRYLRDVMAR